MRRRTVLAGVGVAALAGCMDAIEGPERDEAETGLQAAINDEREAAGVGTLGSRPSLVEAARDHSQDMHDREFYDHRNPDGQEPWDRVGCNAAENIHRGEIGTMESSTGESYQTRLTDDLARYVADGWGNSQSHYENMVDRQWQSIGVGIYIGDDEFFATAMFC